MLVKMKTKLLSQIFLSFFVLALGILAFYEYNKSQKEQEQEKKAAFFIDQELKLKEITAIQIQKDDKKLELVKEGPDWLLKQPLKDLADFAEISRWFDEIKNQKVQKIEKEENSSWKDYYLDEAPKAELKFSSGKVISFSVSKKSTFDGKYFIKRGEELFIAERYFSSEVNEKDFDSFRSKKLMPSLGHAVKIQLWGKEKLKLHWSDYKWSLDKEDNKKKDFPLDFNRLDIFWTDLNSMKASDIKEAVSPESLRKYKLNKPQLEIIFNYSTDTDKKHSLKLSSFKENKAFVSVSHRDFIFEISRENAEKLILSKNEIRDHAFPFKYDKDSAAQIERKNDEKSFTIKKEKSAWQSLDKKEKSVDTKKVADLLDKIKDLKGEKYKPGPAKHNKRYIEIKNSEGETIFELKEVSTSGSHSWVKTNLWTELTAVLKTKLDEIFDVDIIESRPKEEKRRRKRRRKRQ